MIMRVLKAPPAAWLCMPLLILAPLAPGQDIAVMRMMSPEYEAQAGKLRSAPSRLYEFNKGMLGDVIRFLATDAGISFFSLPDGSPEAERMITFSLNSSPFQALETLCKANGLALVLDGGIWYVRPADDKELIGKAYEIRHNSMERVTKITGNSSEGSSGGTGGSSYGSGGSSSGGSSGGGTDSNLQAGGVDLQGARETFKTEKSELINDIRAILDLPPDNSTTGGAAADLGSSVPATAQGNFGNVPTDIYGNIRKPKVLWKSDSNTLYVVATRLQHMWVEGYLAAADKPQALIAIEVKFFETSRDPSSELGLDWTGTLGQTGTFRQAQDVSYDDSTGRWTIESTASPQTEGGFRVDLSHLQQIGDALDAKTFGASPLTSILTAQDLNVKLRAMLRDEETKTVSYPRMITTNNREVAIRAVVNQPVLGGSTSASVGAGATTSSAISYLPIGTVINILPKKMEQNKVNLNVAITVSSIIGTEVIQGNPYPIASSRVYSAPVEIPSGYTVAVGGLDEAKEKETDTGVPVLSKIPVLGYAFKTKSRQKNHKNLMIFITPTLVDPKDGGLPPEPQSVLPIKPPSEMPKVPRLADNGGLVGGIDALPEAIAFMQRSSDEIGQVINENRGTKADFEKIAELKTSLDRLQSEVEGYLTTNPDRWSELNKYKWQIGGIKDEVGKNHRKLLKKGYY